jgi:serine/threonine protein kinase
MLQALDYLTMKGIVHRDVKPENILYESRQGGQYTFQLGDFGLCNHAIVAATFAGSPRYMAPELLQPGQAQTHKVDIWSLYITMLWTLDAGGFRETSSRFKGFADAHEAAVLAASKVQVASVMQEMARINPEERASAAQMLIKCYNGVGLTTPRHQIPPLVSPAKVNTKASAGHVWTSPAPKPREFQREANLAPVVGRFHVEKARFPKHPRQFLSPTEKRPGQALGSRTSEIRRIPGRYPGDTIDSEEACWRPQYT